MKPCRWYAPWRHHWRYWSYDGRVHVVPTGREFKCRRCGIVRIEPIFGRFR